jgi:hypothetical protein
MSKAGDLVGALAANFIAAGIVAQLQGARAAAISFTIGIVLVTAYSLFFRKKDEGRAPNISPTISPNISPSFTQSFNPTINIGVPAAGGAAAAPSGNSRPKLTLDEWDTRGETFDNWQSGFLVTNHGETALEVQVQRFKIADGKFASSSPVASIPAGQEKLIPVWVEGFNPSDDTKWDLRKAIRKRPIRDLAGSTGKKITSYPLLRNTKTSMNRFTRARRICTMLQHGTSLYSKLPGREKSMHIPKCLRSCSALASPDVP